ncbi:MAG: glycoside hydrolase family 3 protein [Thermoleophilaceae bacterium]
MPAVPRRSVPRSARWWSLACALLLAGTLAPAIVAQAGSAPISVTSKADGRAHGWITSKIATMSMEEKVGQLFTTNAYGESADTQEPTAVAANQARYGVNNAAQLMDKYHVGGVIYFAWTGNVKNPHQIATLSNGIQDAAADQESQIPALIATDQEGGIVARVGPPATVWPGNMALGATRSAPDARTAAGISGTELKALGINWDFAPVADVNVNPQNPVIGVRSFSEDPGLAADLTAAQVRGYQDDAGIAAAAKHFPGHGDTSVDSHTGIPEIDHTREEWEQLDRPPFLAAIDAGAESIMSAHIVVPSLDPSRDPATLSRPIMTGILRQEMGYDGVVVTDALDMKGVRVKYGDAQVPVLALKAGVDMLLMPPDFKLAYNSVLDAVRSGEISKRRINQSVYRILRLKWELGLVEDPYVDLDDIPAKVGTPEHYDAAQQVTDRSTTLLKNDDNLLPLTADAGRDVLVTGWGGTTTATIASKMETRGDNADVLETGTAPTEAQITAAVDKARASDVTVVVSYRAWVDSSAQQRELVQRLTLTGKPVIAVSVRDAYDIAYFPDVPAYLATYSWTGVSLESLVRVLYGEVLPTGRLPVTIPEADDPTSTLYPFGSGLTYD